MTLPPVPGVILETSVALRRDAWLRLLVHQVGAGLVVELRREGEGPSLEIPAGRMLDVARALERLAHRLGIRA